MLREKDTEQDISAERGYRAGPLVSRREGTEWDHLTH